MTSKWEIQALLNESRGFMPRDSETVCEAEIASQEFPTSEEIREREIYITRKLRLEFYHNRKYSRL
jgi:hypothetical protein